MKYQIRNFNSDNNSGIVITFEDFSNITKAREALSIAFLIEQEYEVLIDSYVDFEKEIVNASIDSVMFIPLGYYDRYKYFVRFNKLLINFVTSARLYIDHTKHNISSFNKSYRIEAINISNFFSEQYNTHNEYRFMEALRNHIQHRGLPVDSISANIWVEDYKKTDSNILHTFDIYAEMKKLKENNFKKAALSGLDEKINFKPMIRRYVECLSEIHLHIRSQISDAVLSARKLIEDFILKYKEYSNDNIIQLEAVELDKTDNVIQSVPLMLEWDDVRIKLSIKNRFQKNLFKRHVTGEVKK